MLKDILSDLPTKYSTDFLYDFFMPLVNSYKSVSVVMYPLERATNTYIDRPNRVLANCPLRVNLETLEVQVNFPESIVRKLPKVFTGIWRKSTAEGSIADGFLAKNRVVYASDAENTNHLLLSHSADGTITTIINNNEEHHTLPEGFTTIKFGDYEVKCVDGEIKF